MLPENKFNKIPTDRQGNARAWRAWLRRLDSALSGDCHINQLIKLQLESQVLKEPRNISSELSNVSIQWQDLNTRRHDVHKMLFGSLAFVAQARDFLSAPKYDRVNLGKLLERYDASGILSKEGETLKEIAEECDSWDSKIKGLLELERVPYNSLVSCYNQTNELLFEVPSRKEVKNLIQEADALTEKIRINIPTRAQQKVAKMPLDGQCDLLEACRNCVVVLPLEDILEDHLAAVADWKKRCEEGLQQKLPLSRLTQLVNEARGLAFDVSEEPLLAKLNEEVQRAENWIQQVRGALPKTSVTRRQQQFTTEGPAPLPKLDDLTKLVKEGEDMAGADMSEITKIQDVVGDAEDWIGRVREALNSEDLTEEGLEQLNTLLGEAGDIPVVMKEEQVLRVEVQTRRWSQKARVLLEKEKCAPSEVDDMIDEIVTIKQLLPSEMRRNSKYRTEEEKKLREIKLGFDRWFGKYSRFKNSKVMSYSHADELLEHATELPLNADEELIYLREVKEKVGKWCEEFEPVMKAADVALEQWPPEEELPSRLKKINDDPIFWADLSPVVSEPPMNWNEFVAKKEAETAEEIIKAKVEAEEKAENLRQAESSYLLSDTQCTSMCLCNKNLDTSVITCPNCGDRFHHACLGIDPSQPDSEIEFTKCIRCLCRGVFLERVGETVDQLHVSVGAIDGYVDDGSTEDDMEVKQEDQIKKEDSNEEEGVSQEEEDMDIDDQDKKTFKKKRAIIKSEVDDTGDEPAWIAWARQALSFFDPLISSPMPSDATECVQYLTATKPKLGLIDMEHRDTFRNCQVTLRMAKWYIEAIDIFLQPVEIQRMKAFYNQTNRMLAPFQEWLKPIRGMIFALNGKTQRWITTAKKVLKMAQRGIVEDQDEFVEDVDSLIDSVPLTAAILPEELIEGVRSLKTNGIPQEATVLQKFSYEDFENAEPISPLDHPVLNINNKPLSVIDIEKAISGIAEVGAGIPEAKMISIVNGRYQNWLNYVNTLISDDVKALKDLFDFEPIVQEEPVEVAPQTGPKKSKRIAGKNPTTKRKKAKAKKTTKKAKKKQTSSVRNVTVDIRPSFQQAEFLFYRGSELPIDVSDTIKSVLWDQVLSPALEWRKEARNCMNGVLRYDRAMDADENVDSSVTLPSLTEISEDILPDNLYDKMLKLIESGHELHVRTNEYCVIKRRVKCMEFVVSAHNALSGRQVTPEKIEELLKTGRQFSRYVPCLLKRLQTVLRHVHEVQDRYKRTFRPTGKPLTIEMAMDLINDANRLPVHLDISRLQGEVDAMTKFRLKIERCIGGSIVAGLLTRFSDHKRKPSQNALQELIDESNKLSLTCDEMIFIRRTLRDARSWIARVKKCGLDKGEAKVTDLQSLLMEGDLIHCDMEVYMETLRRATQQYCLCRGMHLSAMLECVICHEQFHARCLNITGNVKRKLYTCIRCCCRNMLGKLLTDAANAIEDLRNFKQTFIDQKDGPTLDLKRYYSRLMPWAEESHRLLSRLRQNLTPTNTHAPGTLKPYKAVTITISEESLTSASNLARCGSTAASKDWPAVGVLLSALKAVNWYKHSVTVFGKKSSENELLKLMEHSMEVPVVNGGIVASIECMMVRARQWDTKAKAILNKQGPADMTAVATLYNEIIDIPVQLQYELAIQSVYHDGGSVYCLCRGLNDGSTMIGCDICEEWFHCSCMGIPLESASTIGTFMCLNCCQKLNREYVYQIDYERIKRLQGVTTTITTKTSSSVNVNVRPDTETPKHQHSIPAGPSTSPFGSTSQNSTPFSSQVSQQSQSFAPAPFGGTTTAQSSTSIASMKRPMESSGLADISVSGIPTKRAFLDSTISDQKQQQQQQQQQQPQQQQQHHHQQQHPQQQQQQRRPQMQRPFANNGKNRNNMNNKRGRNNQSNPVELDAIMSGRDHRTTLMIRHIPNKYSQTMLLEEIDNHYRGTYDFFYLPIDFKNRCNVGYAFINFMEPRFIVSFFKEFNGQRWPKFNSEKVCGLSYARIQGKQGLIQRFQNSSLMDRGVECRPLLFYSSGERKGQSEPFPRPTRPLGTFPNLTHLERSHTAARRADMAEQQQQQQPAQPARMVAAGAGDLLVQSFHSTSSVGSAGHLQNAIYRSTESFGSAGGIMM
eukprot:TRINITY_DN588_c0_g1_i12.p1 TRINITY_DN588_c0_g1~~TRINITY_DN588_c0_g1_i12.p1  ORF type:complete len:2120 (-),score=751.89 TRINITY_DN588_c0_g1_i12:303-6662(-)